MSVVYSRPCQQKLITIRMQIFIYNLFYCVGNFQSGNELVYMCMRRPCQNGHSIPDIGTRDTCGQSGQRTGRLGCTRCKSLETLFLNYRFKNY